MADTASYTVETFTAGDGYVLHYRRYPPRPGPPRANLVFIHGIQSHAGWYETSCKLLADAGYQIFFLDRRGSGLNEQARGDTPSYQRLLDDLAEFLNPVHHSPLTTHHSPLMPTFFLAISWGGKLAVALQRQHPGLVAGIVLMCPGFFPRIAPPLIQRLRIGAARLLSPQRLFAIPLNDPQLFTASPRGQDYIAREPTSLHKATARFLVESVRLDRYVGKAAGSVNVPVLLMLAEHDRIIDNRRTCKFVESFDSPDRQIIVYRGAHHTLEFEPNLDRIVIDMQCWLERQTAAVTGSPQR